MVCTIRREIMIRKGQTFFILDYETTGVRDNGDDYPIEIGLIVTDHDFNVLTTYENIIGWEVDFFDNQGALINWKEEYKYAADNFHKIHPNEYNTEKRSFQNVVYDMMMMCQKYSYEKIKPILVSDNIQFEWRNTKQMFNAADADWPFHYCGWDTSLLLESTPVGDPEIVEHRALSDAAGLHRHIIRALEYNGYWNRV